MEQSPRLFLSYLAPSQAQKHVTVNETFRRLDQLVQASVSSRTTAAEPGSPADGDAYILPASPTGTDWATFSQHSIAAYQDGAWTEIVPKEGWRAWVADADELVVFNGSAWINYGEGGAALKKLGVNTTADATNRLAVKSDAILFSHDDVTPGNDDCIVKVNKKAAGDTASHLFQTNFSGRAEFGLTGDDDFHVKVSADGVAWTEAFFIGKTDGRIGIGTTVPAQAVEVREINSSTPNVAVSGDLTSSEVFIFSRDDGNPSGFAGIVCGASSGARQVIKGTRAHGTVDAPTSVADADLVFSFLGEAYDGAARYGTAGIDFLIEGAVSSGNVPQAIRFLTGQTTSRLARGRIAPDGGLVWGSPTGDTKGAGTINAQGVYDDNTLLSCYVFDQTLDGAVSVEKWDAKVPDRRIIERDPETGAVLRDEAILRTHEPLRRFAARIGTKYDPLTLDGYAAHWKEKRHLTALPNEAAFDPVNGTLTAGEWIQRLVETAEIQAVLIEALNARVKALEAAAGSAAPTTEARP